MDAAGRMRCRIWQEKVLRGCVGVCSSQPFRTEYSVRDVGMQKGKTTRASFLVRNIVLRRCRGLPAWLCVVPKRGMFRGGTAVAGVGLDVRSLY